MNLCNYRTVSPLLALLALLSAPAALADDLVWTTGRVADSSGQPVAGATVAVYDVKNRVVDYVKTDASGEYTLAVPRSALNLPKRRGGFIHQVSRSVNSLVGGAGRVAGAPLKAGIRAAGSLVAVTDPITRVGLGAAVGLATSMVDIVTGTGVKRGTLRRTAPGVVAVKVVADGHNDAVALGRVYWMQEELYRVDGRDQRALVAWMDPVRLSPSTGEGPSTIASDYLCFTGARISPGIVERGQEVTVTVTFRKPPEPRTPVVVVARNARTGKTYGLDRIGEDRYQCRFVVDKRHPLNDQMITVLAYAEQEVRPGRNQDAERAIGRAGLWDPNRPFVYDPLLLAGRNRVELVLTVVDLGKR
ncbi:MAG: carboxypeptidase regulatory-like domain-containing protein [Armatimonadetes bacterium]|nr:carboxypeptidase regulatory-like domain-containing protein [Armatimonadota bacterium]